MAKIVKFLEGQPLASPLNILRYDAIHDGVMQPPQANSVTFLGPQGHKVVFKGSFVVENGIVTGGIATGFDIFAGSMKVMKAKGYAVAWADLDAAIDDLKSYNTSAFGDLFFAGAKLKGSKADDFIEGRNDSKVLGEDGNDFLRGDYLQHNVVLKGGDGDDVLASNGASRLFGGEGEDIFVLNTDPAGAADVFADFDPRDDVIAIYPGMIAGLPVGPLDEAHFNIGKQAETPDHTIIYDRKSGGLYIDLDGSGAGAQVQFARLPEKLKLTADNIMIADFL